MPAKKTPFYQKHIALHAKMAEFAGFEMPIYYEGIMQEHLRVREKVGMFDLSHMGEFIVRGPQALAFLEKMTINSVSSLEVYQAQYSAMCYPSGGIVDDLIVYRMPDQYMLVVNAANISKDFAWLKENLPPTGVELIDVSDQTALLAIQGPLSERVLQKLTQVELSKIRYYWATHGEVCSEKIFFSRTGYTGEDGFELYLKPELAGKFWDAVAEAGKEFDIAPVGLGARDTLRLEMRYCLYGNDIDETTNPFEAGLGWITKLDKGDFIGKEALVRIKQEGTKRKLVAFELKERGFPRKGYPIIKNEQEIGRVTSGTFSPSLNKGIGLGYVQTEFSEIGTELWILVKGRGVPAVVVKPPFWKKGSHK